ncbi:hypothetical protein V3Q90_09500 [Flavobacterium oreochromis]|uniref:Uncharacterized protein n=1 Tax=Flavobacterium oreochromis TaxID=2906078 RepID=A0ABW8P8P6_9FLAO|nr:hypothetical protein [Flavobacterium oreochromis]OWP75164.1 hypothetical protein BWG23_11890 [Flavobacterium oreochromis]
MKIYDIALCCENYYPIKKIKWIRDVSSDTKNLTFFEAHLYNSVKKRKKYSLKLYTIYNELDNSCVLLIMGKLKFWFHQEYLVNELTDEEYEECLKLLHTELDLIFTPRKRRLLKSKHMLLYHKNNEYRYYIYDFYLSDKKLDEVEKIINRAW